MRGLFLITKKQEVAEMEIQNNTATEQNPDVAAKGADSTAAADTSGQAENAAAETAKTYDQAYIDKLLADQKAAQEAAVAEALKVATMDAESKAKYEKEQHENALKEREAAIARRELLSDARDVLAKKDVPAEFLDMLVGKDLKETEANADAFKKQFDAAVQAQVEKRLAGRTPQTGNGSGSSSVASLSAEIDKYL